MARLFLLLFAFSLYAKEVYLLTQEAKATKKQIELKKSFGLDYNGYHVEAKYGRYDKNSSKIHLFKDIELLQKEYNIYAIRGDLDLKQDRFKLSDFLFSQNKTSLWADGEKIEGNRSKVSLESAFISSCKIDCSDWKFYFGWGTLYKDIHWVNLYNIAFYVHGVPIFYFPYIGFSTLKKRTTGFLRPTIGLSDKEGFIYIQPFFYAPTNWWDLQLDPQIRSKRGKGIYATLRFVDSPTSYGEVTTGIFQEKRSFQEQYNIKNRYHRGAQLFYKKEQIFSKDGAQDGFYGDVKLYNDIDYFNLQKQVSFGYSNALDISRVNYYYSDDKNYLGITARYYKYNNKSSANQQVHIMPSIKYHRFVAVPFKNFNFAYNADVEVTHYYQKNGLSAIEYNTLLPLKIYATFFDGYLGASATENINYVYADYYNVSSSQEKPRNYQLFRNGHQFALYGNVGRSYAKFFHSISYDASLYIPSYERIKGTRVSFVNIVEAEQKHLDLALKNYFNFFKSNKLFYHFIKQRVTYDADRKFQDLENEFGYEQNNFDLYISAHYSYYLHAIKAFALTANYSGDGYRTNIGYLYNKRYKTSNTLEDTQFVTFSASGDLSNHNELFATIDYNINDHAYKEWSLGWKKRMKCWSFYTRFKRSRVPILTPNGPSSYSDNTFLFRIELYPLGVIEKSIRSTSGQRNF